MAIVELYSGTEAISTTEWSMVNDSSTIATDTTDGVFQPFLDLSDMVAADVLQIRVYEKVRAADTQRILYEWILVGAQSTPNFATPALILMHGWDGTLKGLSGTITVTWSIRQLT